MRDADKTKEQLIAELTAMRQRVAELEGTSNSDRSTAERALSEAEQLYRNILDNAVAGFFQTTPDGRYLVVNHAMARIFGYSSPLEMIDAIDDARQQLYVNPSDRDDFEHLLNELDAVKEFEYLARRKDGSTVWVSDNARAVRDRDGTILYYEGSSIDISERKEAEAELERTVEERTAALQESNDILVLEVVKHHRSLQELNAARAQLKAILDTVPGIVSCVSADLRYLGVNQHLARAFDAKPEEFVGQDIGFLGASIEFSQFVRDFFGSDALEACREIDALVQLKNTLKIKQPLQSALTSPSAAGRNQNCVRQSINSRRFWMPYPALSPGLTLTCATLASTAIWPATSTCLPRPLLVKILAFWDREKTSTILCAAFSAVPYKKPIKR